MTKFREITPSSEVKLILGKDAKGNDALVSKFAGKPNIILHTKAPGSPFCVIESPIKPSKVDVYNAAKICARYSQDWRDNKKDVIVSIFTGKSVSKPEGSKTGSWVVKKAIAIKVKKEDILKLVK